MGAGNSQVFIVRESNIWYRAFHSIHEVVRLDLSFIAAGREKA